MRNTSGSTLTEVMIMMVILWISLTGIFGLVNSGQKLASITDTRLIAINIAREGLESVTTLRDTFSLARFASGTCETTGDSAFFTIDGSQILDDNCPQPEVSWLPYYILDDEKKLIQKDVVINDTEVCINEFGWYSQEFSVKETMPGPQVTCVLAPLGCTGNTTQSCKTKFKRKITFKACTMGVGGTALPTDLCIVATSTVWWWSASDQTISLAQLITVK